MDHLYIVFVMLSCHCCLVVTCWERADLLFVIFNCVFVIFPCGILGQVWYLIILIPDLCRLSYFAIILMVKRELVALLCLPGVS